MRRSSSRTARWSTRCERLGRANDKHPPAFRSLWEMAIKHGLLRDEGFREWQRRHALAPGPKSSTEWMRRIGESLAGVQNELCMGRSSSTLSTGRFCRWWLTRLV